MPMPPRLQRALKTCEQAEACQDGVATSVDCAGNFTVTCMVFVLVFVVVVGYLHQLLLQGCLIYLPPFLPR